MEARLLKQAAEGKVHDAIAGRLRGVFDELPAGTDLRGRRVLDAGCDIAEKLVRRAGAVASSRGVVGDACNLCFKDDAFEIVISSEMIEHTSNRVGQGVVRLASSLHLRPFHGLENFVRRSELRAAGTAPDLDVLEHISLHAWPFQ